MNFSRTSYSSKVTFMPLIQYLITEPSVIIILVSINTEHFLHGLQDNAKKNLTLPPLMHKFFP